MAEEYIGITLPIRVTRVTGHSSIDSDYGPYLSINNALECIPYKYDDFEEKYTSRRGIGLTVAIYTYNGVVYNTDDKIPVGVEPDGIVEYWWKSGITDADLVVKCDLNKKVDKEIDGSAGKAMIFNEADGGGAKFEYDDGTASYVGVHDKSNGVGVQIYVDKDSTSGTIIDVTENGAYYHKGEWGTASERDVEENEIATKGDIAAITIPEYSVVKQENAEEGYLFTYNLTKDGASVGASINIPKDFLIKSASVNTVTADNVPYAGAKVGDKYIDFVINVKEGTAADEHLYLPVNDLVDVYTAGNGIEISNSNVISTKAVQVTVNGEAGTYIGQANIPVYFDITPAVDKVTVNSYSITLGGEDNQTATKYSMDVPCATTTTAGLMSAEDKEKLEAAVAGGVTSIKEGNGIAVSTTAEGASSTKPEVSVKLDETSKTEQGDNGSGLTTSANGLKIDDSLTWVFNCGNASILIK